jgi:tripartite-type tricarboxylate transporter receptor subunit TctC
MAITRLLSTSVSAAAFAAVTWLQPLPAFAGAKDLKPANYPNRPITIVICYGKGGGADQAVAALQAPAEKILGVNIIKVNKPGGGGLNCLADFRQTPPDGYTILSHSDPLASSYVKGQHDLNPVKDLKSLVIMNVAPSGMYIRTGDERFTTNGKPDWKKVVAYAKDKNGQMTISNAPTDMELTTSAKLEKFFGFTAKQVLFDDPAQRYGAVIGGKLDILMEQPGDIATYLEAKNLSPVLSIWPERFKNAPDTPATGADFGMKWNPLLKVRALWLQKGTPENIVRYLEAVFDEAYHTPEHLDFIKRQNLDIVESFYNSKQMEDVFSQSLEDYAEAFKAQGVKVREGM